MLCRLATLCTEVHLHQAHATASGRDFAQQLKSASPLLILTFTRPNQHVRACIKMENGLHQGPFTRRRLHSTELPYPSFCTPSREVNLTERQPEPYLWHNTWRNSCALTFLCLLTRETSQLLMQVRISQLISKCLTFCTPQVWQNFRGTQISAKHSSLCEATSGSLNQLVSHQMTPYTVMIVSRSHVQYP